MVAPLFLENTKAKPQQVALSTSRFNKSLHSITKDSNLKEERDTIYKQIT